MFAERLSVTLTTDSSGDAVGYIPDVTGRVLSVVYTKVDFANGVDITITSDATGLPILALTDQNASGAWHPRQQVHGPTGAGLTLDGTRTANEPVTLASDRVKIVVAQGGSVKTGTITIIVG